MTVWKIVQAGLWAFGASAFCAVYFNAEKKDILFGAVLGSAGWILYTVFKNKTGSEALGFFIGAFAASSSAEILAVITHHPATVYLVPGIIPLVPGGGIFLMMRAAVQGEFQRSLSAGYSTLTSAVAITLGIAIATSAARIASTAYRAGKRRIHGKADTDFIPDDFEP